MHTGLAIALAAGAAACGSSAPEPRTGGDEHTAAMADAHAHDAPEPTGATVPEPREPLVVEDVEYAPGARGTLARPQSGAPSAGLIVIHEWWGLNDNIRAMTRRLAGEGYLALAVDVYGGRAADDPAGARALMEQATADEAGVHANLAAAARLLASRGVRRIGVIGWCFGGGWALKTALAMPDRIDAAVMYYGAPITDRTTLQRLDAPLLGVFGGADAHIPLDRVREMESTLRALGKTVEIHVYEGADHAFANPSGRAYQAEPAEDAWRRTTEWLALHLGSGPGR